MKQTYKKLARLLMTTMMTVGLMLAGQTGMAGTTSGTKTFDKGENLQVTSDVKAAVDFLGVVGPHAGRLRLLRGSPGEAPLRRRDGSPLGQGSPVFGGRDGGILADKKAANPIHYISKTSAPMLLMHGTADTIVSPSQTDLLYQALQQKGIPSERYLVTGAAHGGKYWVQEPVLNIITDFFDRYLK